MKNDIFGNSLSIQWLRLSAFTSGAHIQSLVGKLRSHEPCSRGKKKKKKNKYLRLETDSIKEI